MRLSLPGGPGSNGAGLRRGAGADGGVDLGRASGVHLPGLFGDAGDGPGAQAPRRTRVGLDPVAELHRLGRRRHTTGGGGGMKVVTEQGRVQRLPAASFVAHVHEIGHQDMVVGLGVAASGRGVPGHGPGEPTGRRAHLRPSPPAALLLDDLVEIAHGGVPLGVGDGVHIFGPADDPELGHRLVRTDHQLHTRPQAADQALVGLGVMGPPVAKTALHSSTSTSPDRPSSAAPEPPHTIGVSPRDA
jgi:hypothetical protein